MKRLGKLNCVTVWLVLLGFLCGLMMPAVSVARVHREIDTEGDPGDGWGVAGGGSFGQEPNLPTGESEWIDSERVVVVFVAVRIDGTVVVQVELVKREFEE